MDVLFQIYSIGFVNFSIKFLNDISKNIVKKNNY